MARTYPERSHCQRLGMGCAAALIAVAGLTASAIPLAAATNFESQPLEQERFAILAQAVGTHRWKLLLLEQIKAQPLCWEDRSDGLVNPALNHFDYTGICGRYLSSNDFSLRTGGTDAGPSFRLRVDGDSRGLTLTAMDPNRGVPIVVARATNIKRDREAFVKLSLEPGWSLERRTYQGQTLGHVYLAHSDSTEALLARAGAPSSRSGFADLNLRAPKPPIRGGMAYRSNTATGRGPIPLEVIPFQP